VDVYPNQPRSQGGWPDQPPQYSEQPGNDEARSGPGQHQGARPLPPRRRRRRGWIGLLIVLVVLAVLFVIGDQVAKAYAQNTIASKIQSSSGMSSKPSVSIEGFPFLTQVAAHDVRVIDISANNVQAGKFDISSVKAKATGVHLNSSFSGATIDQINGTALITFASL
jgi:cytoskeletal protein RodZ